MRVHLLLLRFFILIFIAFPTSLSLDSSSWVPSPSFVFSFHTIFIIIFLIPHLPLWWSRVFTRSDRVKSCRKVTAASSMTQPYYLSHSCSLSHTEVPKRRPSCDLSLSTSGMSAPTGAQEKRETGTQLCIQKCSFIVMTWDPTKQNSKTGNSCRNVCEDEQMKLLPEDAELWELEGCNICLDFLRNLLNAKLFKRVHSQIIAGGKLMQNPKPQKLLN